MPRPQFVTCSLCGRGFGSASINIHIPQCYEKAIKRWRLNPDGPKPVMPALRGSNSTRGVGGLAGSAVRGDTRVSDNHQLCGTGATAARALHSGPGDDEQPQANLNLHMCAKCSRSFNFDRIAYHERVCKGNAKRRVFDSYKQRTVGDDDTSCGYGNSYSGKISKGKKNNRSTGGGGGGNAGGMGIPRTNWRQQHEDFIRSIRSARESESQAQAMWGAPAFAARSQNARGGLESQPPRAAPFTTKRVPPCLARQDKFLKEKREGGECFRRTARNVAPTGSGNRSGPSRQVKPHNRAFGGGGERFSYHGGGGGGPRIINDNTTSVGLLQALGRM